MNRAHISLSLLTLSALMACQEQRDDVANAVNAAKQVAEMTSNLKAAGEKAEAAGKLAEEQAKAQLAAGADPKQVQEQVELAKGLAAMQALAAGGGPVVSWRHHGKFLPDTIGDAKAEKPLDGRTEKMGAMQVSNAKRRYALGESRATVTLTDTTGSPLLRAPFSLAAMVSEDSSSGFKKGKKVAGYTAIVEWREQSKRSEATLLVGDRFVVHVEIDKAPGPDAAEVLAQRLPLDEIAKLKAEEAKAEPAK